MANCLTVVRDNLFQDPSVHLSPLCTLPSVLPFIHLSLQHGCLLFCCICFLYEWRVSNQGVRKVWKRGRRESVSHCTSERLSSLTARGDLLWKYISHVECLCSIVCTFLPRLHSATHVPSLVGIRKALETRGGKGPFDYTLSLSWLFESAQRMSFSSSPSQTQNPGKDWGVLLHRSAVGSTQPPDRVDSVHIPLISCVSQKRGWFPRILCMEIPCLLHFKTQPSHTSLPSSEILGTCSPLPQLSSRSTLLLVFSLTPTPR